MPAPLLSRRVRFGPFVVDFNSFELFKHDIRLKLQDQPFQILRLLVQRRGDLVTRDELRMELWTESTFVDFDAGLNAAVRRLRDTLSDSADTPRYIETLPRHGYRFIAEVEELPDRARELKGEKQEPAEAPVTVPAQIEKPKDARSLEGWLTRVPAIWFPVVGLLFLLFVLKTEGWKNLFVSHASNDIHSILVMPSRTTFPTA